MDFTYVNPYFLWWYARWLLWISQRSNYKLLHLARASELSPATRTLSKHDNLCLIYFLACCEEQRQQNWLSFLETLFPYLKHDVLHCTPAHITWYFIRWIEGDAVNLPFSISSFDAATIGYGLRNIVDRKIALEEMYRVLKPGSKVSILDFNKSPSQLTSSIQVHGYNNYLFGAYFLFFP